MGLTVRAMRDEEAPAVVKMVFGIAAHTGGKAVPKLTPEKLLAARDLIDVVVAEDDGAVLGACLGLVTYSTYRAERGLYVVDLFVVPEARGSQIGESLLRETARRAARKGAGFIKLEVDETNIGAARFYGRLGFVKKTEDRLHVLEQDRLEDFIGLGRET